MSRHPHFLGRLVGRKMFSHVFNNGKRFCWKSMHILLMMNDLPYPRVGFIISKRYVRTSVMRHCIKRKIRALIRNDFGRFSGLDIIVCMRASDPKNTRASMRKQVATVFESLMAKQWPLNT